MQTSLIAVGNSKGIRLPKAILAQCGIEDQVCLKVTDEGLLISPVRSPRQGWEDAIKADCCVNASEGLAAFTEMRNAFDAEKRKESDQNSCSDDVEEWTWPDQNT